MNHLLPLLMLTYVLFSQCDASAAMGELRNLPAVDFTLAEAQKSDVIYKHHQKAGGEFKILTEEDVGEEALDKTIPTVLLIHGWTTDDTSPWYAPLRDEYFKLGAHNIIYINWSKAGNKSYDVSSANVRPVGRFIAQFLIASGVPLEKIQIVGHSLGSQLAGFIGKTMIELTGKKIGRITALDPAGPKFENSKMADNEKLCEHDADFVDVIHTDVRHYGFTKPTGHVDFYPNEGKHQPGCPPQEKDDNCSHARSTLYFIESLSKKAEALEANFTENSSGITVSPKENGKVIIFGQHVDRNAKGVYYFKTNSQKPFLA
uniref:Pancreatic triacylglycerol lipase 1 n=1 Tax=Colaphellus bowringi TaxID=561076 RepID=A0A8U0ATR3_9CUCU|nr:pancreatic triacylglycerol lipase 1 [Colaphellus bowringi]